MLITIMPLCLHFSSTLIHMTRPQLTCLLGKVAVPPCLGPFGARSTDKNIRKTGEDEETWLGDASTLFLVRFTTTVSLRHAFFGIGILF